MIRLALFFIVVTSSAFAQSQPEMNAEAALNLEKSDALLNKIYSQLLKQGDDEFDKRQNELDLEIAKFDKKIEDIEKLETDSQFSDLMDILI